MELTYSWEVFLNEVRVASVGAYPKTEATRDNKYVPTKIIILSRQVTIMDIKNLKIST